MKKIIEILKNQNVVAAAVALGKAVLTAALATFGVSWFVGCSLCGSGIGVTM